VVRVYIEFFLTLVGLISGFSIIKGVFRFFLLCELLFCCMFLFVTYIAYGLERDTEDVDEVYIAFRYIFIKAFLCLYNESAMFF